jgi:DNA-binding beta-propeller fold protein YncE
MTIALACLVATASAQTRPQATTDLAPPRPALPSTIHGPAAAYQADHPPPAGGYRLVKTYQSTPTPPLGVIEDPVGITVAADGTVFVVDRALHRAQRFTADGEPLAQYGRPGADPGQLFQPSGIAVDLARDRVYISDTGNLRVSVHQLDGTFVEVWGTYTDPRSIAVGRDGQVYLHEPATGQMLRLSVDGQLQSQFSALSYGPPLDRATGVAAGLTIGPNGHLFMALGLGVREFLPDGTLLGSANLNPAGSALSRDVTFDAAGQMYVLEEARVTHRLAGGLVAGTAVARYIRAIAGGPRGVLYLLVPKTLDQPAGVVVRRFEGTRQANVSRWGIPLTVLGWLNQPLRLSFGADGSLYVVDELRRVQRFDPELNAALGQLTLPGLQEAEALPNGDLVVARTRYGSSDQDPDDADAAPPGKRRVRIERYSLGGSLTSAERPVSGTRLWADERIEPATDSEATRIVALKVDPNAGRVYALDAGHKRVLVFDEHGAALPEIPLPPISAGLPDYTDLAVGPDGRLAVLHTAARQLFRFRSDGTAEGVLDLPEWPWRLDIGAGGSLFLPTARRWLWELSSAGRLQAVWPLPQPTYDDPRPPSDLAAGPDGRIYVLDQASTAIYVFARDEADVTADPPPGSLVCAIAGTSSATPSEVLIGEPAEITLHLGGDCPGHRRTGHRPELLLRSAAVSVTLRADVQLVPGSVRPPAQVAGRTLTWTLDDVPPAGIDLRYALTAATSNRLQTFERGGLRGLDGWFNYGAVELTPAVFYTLLPSTPTPSPTDPPPAPGELFLPVLLADALAAETRR